MALFEYQGLSASGRMVTGQIEAASHDQASDLLQQMQLEVRQIEHITSPRTKGRISTSEFLLFNRQLSEITDSGIPLSEGLRQASKDVLSGRLRRAIESVCEDLDAGVDPPQAFEKHSRDFPAMYGQIVKAGIKSGRLGDMLACLNRHMETAQHTKRMLWDALMYPAFLFLLGTIIFFLVGIKLFPAISAIRASIDDFGGTQPRIVMQFWWVMGLFLSVVGAIAGSIMIYIVGGFTRGGRIFREKFVMRIPFLGSVYKRSHLTVLSDAMSVLINAGCDITDTLRLAAKTTGFENFCVECDLVASQVEQGATLVEAGRFAKTIPQIFFYSMQTGAQRNELAETLHNMSDMYGWQTSITQSYLSAILAPIAVIFVGLCIGSMVLMLFSPMVSMLQNMG